MGTEPKTHVFRKPCGCVTELIVDVPQTYATLGRAYRYASKHGESHELMETEAARKIEWKCVEHKEAPKKGRSQHAGVFSKNKQGMLGLTDI